MHPKEYLCCWSVKMNRMFGRLDKKGEDLLEQRGTAEFKTPKLVHLKNSRLLMWFSFEGWDQPHTIEVSTAFQTGDSSR